MLQKEPVTLFDLGMHKLEFTLDSHYEDTSSMFQKDHKNITFITDAAYYDTFKDTIEITRFVKGSSDLSTCTIAIQTLRKLLTKRIGGTIAFMGDHFWHADMGVTPKELYDLDKHIYFKGHVAAKPTFECYSRLDEDKVNIGGITKK